MCSLFTPAYLACKSKSKAGNERVHEMEIAAPGPFNEFRLGKDWTSGCAVRALITSLLLISYLIFFLIYLFFNLLNEPLTCSFLLTLHVMEQDF